MSFIIIKQKNSKSLILILSFLCLSFCGFSQSGRSVVSLNSGWEFKKDVWKKISIPHTWNNIDVTDDEPDYFRGICWYKKKIDVDKNLKGKKLSLYFEGVNQEAEIFVNGEKAGTHIGGYTGFSVSIDKFINFSEGAENIIEVKVNNAHNDNIPPLSADFTFFGGIYRDVFLVINEPVHFSAAQGAGGVFITTPDVSEKTASVSIKSNIVNESVHAKKIRVKTTIKTAQGDILSAESTLIKLNAGESNTVIQQAKKVLNPNLWSPEDPYLYQVVTQINDAVSGELLDIVINPLGFRWFKFDASTGFHLNGKPYKLLGSSRHQDFKNMGNALPDEYHVNDLKLIKQMGGNFLRVAHYPQDPAVLETCDRIGLLASVEIPIVNAITESEEFYQNCRNMQVEMIRQNFNHPSVILWAYMNEVMLRPKFAGQEERQKKYFNNITKLAEELELLTRREDPSRYTMMSFHGDFNRYNQYRLTEIPMVLGWNLYQGWYSGNIDGFAEFLDRHHQNLPDKPLMVTEYGADADPRIRASNPVRFDKSIDYSLDFHENYLQAIKSRPFVAAGMIWNLADFNSETRDETMPHINNKGLLSLDREPKDLYFFYQSQLLKTPFLKISNWISRTGVADSVTASFSQNLDVFSNASKVELIVNNRSIGVRESDGKRFTWKVPFIQGANIVEAVMSMDGKEYRDMATVNFEIIPRILKKASFENQINILLGADRIFTDEETKQVWIPGQEYHEGSWGNIGGAPFKLAGRTQQPYGTSRNIRETDNDPVYQTQLVGIEKYRFDVADGEYDLTLHFAELTTNENKEALPYNLVNSAQAVKAEERIFDILINNQPVFRNFSISGRYGELTAGSEKVKVLVEGGKGLEIAFRAVTGKPALNALQLKKVL